MNNVGKIVQIIGPVLDIRFEDGELPNILNAIEIDNKGQRLVAEVAQHIGDNVVRCISMGSTDGLVRGMDAVDTGEGIKVPVGEETLGRIFNVLGDRHAYKFAVSLSPNRSAVIVPRHICTESLKYRSHRYKYTFVNILRINVTFQFFAVNIYFYNVISKSIYARQHNHSAYQKCNQFFQDNRSFITA